jgi:hypothetical protein
LTERRPPTERELSDFTRDARSDVKGLQSLIESARAEARAETKDVLREINVLRERLVVLEQFKSWHDRDWDDWKGKISKLEDTVRRLDRMVWYALGAGAAGGGATATLLSKLLGG